MALKTFFLVVVLGIVATISVAVPAEDGVPSVAKSEAVREVGEFETSIRPRCKKYEYIYCKKCHKVKKCIKYSYGKCTKVHMGESLQKRLFAVRSASSITN